MRPNARPAPRLLRAPTGLVPSCLLACVVVGALACAGPAGDEAASDAVASPASGAAATPVVVSAEAGWLEDLNAWRAGREERLHSPEGYLALSGLHWLGEGPQTFGASPDCDLPLAVAAGAADAVPAVAGELEVVDGGVQLTARPDAALRLQVDGEPLRSADRRALLRTDAGGDPSRVTLGPLTFWVVDRAGRLGVRVRDPGSHVLADFDGTSWFAPDPSWRVEARYEPYAAPRAVGTPNILGTTYDAQVPGALVFERDGRIELLPTGADAGSLSLMFGDATNGRDSYAGGRFLAVPAPDADGLVVLDFNRSYNPPCAFTPYTTCPLPLPENVLDLEVAAGERDAAH